MSKYVKFIAKIQELLMFFFHYFFIKIGNLKKAAKIKKMIAEMYEKDLAYELAAKYFNEAAELFYSE